jgi:hypothetical protein
MSEGSLIAATAARATAAVAQTAASPTNDMNPQAVAQATPQLQASIATAIAPVIANLTNAEAHFWQKRTFWSQVGSGFAALGFIATPIIDYMQHHTTSGGVSTVTALGLAAAAWSGYSAYRAGRASTPLGTPEKPRLPYPLNRG